MKTIKQEQNIALAISAISALVMTGCVGSDAGQRQVFDLREIASRHSDKITVSDSDIFEGRTLKISPVAGNEGVTVWEKGDGPDWTAGRYLVFETYGDNDFSGVITIEFYKGTPESASGRNVLQGGTTSGSTGERPWISCRMGTLPHLKTKVVFPLSYLDAQQLFVTRSPRQLKGTITGDRLDPADIAKVILRFGPYNDPFFQPSYEVASIAIMEELPEPYPVTEPAVDKLGQRNDKEWPGKLADEEDLVARNRALLEETKNVQPHSEFSRYGGWKELRFAATGFFRTHHDGKRWWMVDPEGYAFLSTGVDCIGANSSGPVTGIEDMFEWLPEPGDPVFGEAIRAGEGYRNMDFYRANLIRAFGAEWKQRWEEITAGLIRKFRFNTVANWSDVGFARRSNIPYVLELNRFPTTETRIYRDFPDVFSEEYLTNSVRFASQLEEYKDDPCMVGYFLRNEPQWAFGYHNLAYEMFATDQQSVTKTEFVKWISDKYSADPKALGKAWGLELGAIDDLLTMTFKDYPSEQADKDFHEFSVIMVKMYVDIPCDEVEKIDGNHLNLGMRYAWISSDMLYQAGERFDIFSINGYGLNPPKTEDIARISGKPVMIGEFHHGATDRALPATGIVGVPGQSDRGAAVRNYIEQGFARPELVGMHYFQWVDQPYTGRGDGENYNIGVVTTGNIPYPELTEAMTITNERIYKVASGAVEPFKANVANMPPIFY
jgi:hypothetical protein